MGESLIKICVNNVNTIFSEYFACFDLYSHQCSFSDPSGNSKTHSGKINNCHLWTGMEANVNLTNWEIISFVCSIVSAGTYCVCWADIHLLRLFPEGFGRRLSKWRLVRNGLMTGAACLSFLLVFAPLRIVSITLTGSYIGSSEWLNSLFFFPLLFSLKKLLSGCQSANTFYPLSLIKGPIGSTSLWLSFRSHPGTLREAVWLVTWLLPAPAG